MPVFFLYLILKLRLNSQGHQSNIESWRLSSMQVNCEQSHSRQERKGQITSFIFHSSTPSILYASPSLVPLIHPSISYLTPLRLTIVCFFLPSISSISPKSHCSLHLLLHHGFFPPLSLLCWLSLSNINSLFGVFGSERWKL